MNKFLHILLGVNIHEVAPYSKLRSHHYCSRGTSQEEE